MDNIFERVKKMVWDLGYDEDEMTMESCFVKDLGVDSLDLESLYLMVDEEFEVYVDDEFIHDGKVDETIKVKDLCEYIDHQLYLKLLSEVVVSSESMEERLKQAQALLDSKQYTEAATMVEALANEGYAPAMAQMGALYGRGQGVAKDYNKMDEWDRKATEAFRISAEQGDAEGQCGYGACFQYTVSPDLAKAAFWYEKAAAQGHKRAKEELAKLKAEGKI